FKSYQEMADFLGVSKKIIHDIIHGYIDVNPAYIDKFVKEKKVSRQWYDYGTGQMVTDGSVKPKSTITDIGDIKAQLASLESQVAVLKIRNQKMMEIIEKIEKRLDEK